MSDEVGIIISKAAFPSPFSEGLEYVSPARGTWNIVHVGMLVPEAHEIFACAQGCLRGVVLTAAEMGASHRFSTIAVRENNVLDGDMEELLIQGVLDILEKLPKKPPAVLLYTSCIHHFMGTDLNYVYEKLRKAYPDIAFADCYMNPIMRKSGLTPDQLMRRQLYSLLKPREKNPKVLQIAAGDFAISSQSEILESFLENGYEVRQISQCRTYEAYEDLSEASVCITTFPSAKAAGNYLEERLGQKHLYLPASFSMDVIEKNRKEIQKNFHLRDLEMRCRKRKEKCEKALRETSKLLQGTEIYIDHTAVPMVLSLAQLLISHGFLVTRIYGDQFLKEEKEIFTWLQREAPDLLILPTTDPFMRVIPKISQKKILAIGQKAAYFAGTDYFVNIAEGAGMFGYEGICQLMEWIQEAYLEKKNRKDLIQIKGLGCGTCL